MRDFHKQGRSAVYATNGMCATSHPLAAKVAVQMLESGGNAVDAAIAGAVAVTVPGAIDAFCTLSKDFGKLGLKASLAPAIHYAEAGVPVAPRVAFDWAQAVDALQGVARDDYLLAGKAPNAGQMFRAPKQADVLRRIAMDGRDGFYTGEVAEDMVASLNAMGGSHTLDDFANCACEYTAPITGGYGGLDLWEHPPNGQGATAVLLLNILKHFDIAGMDPFGVERAHIEAEATKLAYDARNRFVADPDHMDKLDHMLAPETAAGLAALIDRKRAMPASPPGAEAVHKDTIYITVVDKDRMCVSLIYSVLDGCADSDRRTAVLCRWGHAERGNRIWRRRARRIGRSWA